MNADFNNMQLGDYVMIASTVEVEDNAKLYTRGENQWIFITDFSGATGIRGETGLTPNIQIGTVTQGSSFNVTRTGTNENPVLNFTLVKGDKGERGIQGIQGLTGNGIASITKTGTSGLVDTYTITYTNGNTTTFTITNGEDGEVTETELNVLREKVANQQKVIDQLPQVTGQGTEVTLEDTIEAPFTKFDVEGNSTQETTTGKNLLPNNATTQTYFGITITKKDNGTLILNGTATDIIQLNLLNNKRNNTMLPEADTKYSLESGIYKLSGCTNGSSSTYKLDVWVDGAEGLKATCFNQEVQFTLDEEKIVSYLRLVVYSGATLNNVVIKPMIRLASITDDTYEPYTGGIASPNPNYEQPIKSAGDNGSINEKIQTRNLFDKDKAKNVDYYIEPTTGNKVTQMGCMMSDYIKVSENTNYVRNKKNDSNGNTFFASLIFYDKNKNYISGLWYSDNTFITPVGTRYINLFSTRNRTNNENEEFVQDFMIEQGSTATPYVEHEEQDYSIFVQQPFRSIGDVRDCFVKKSDGWYERHYITRNYLKDYTYYFAVTADGNLFRIVASQLLDIKKVQQTLMCNIFIGIPSSTNRTNGNIYYNSYAGVVDIICNDYDNETDFKTMTINKNGYFDCILAEPLDLPCTEEQIEQLENLPSTYKDFTIIQSEDETPAYLEVSGIYDLNNLINN